MEFIFEENGLTLLFKVNEKGRLLLLYMGPSERLTRPEAKRENGFLPYAVQINGEYPYALRGSKHNGFCGEEFLYRTHSDVRDADGRHITFTLANGEAVLYLRYDIPQGTAAVRCRSELENKSDSPLGLSFLSSFMLYGIDGGNWQGLRLLVPHNAWAEELNWREYTLEDLGLHKTRSGSTKRVAFSSTGTWSAKDYLPMGAILNTVSGAMLFQIEHNGAWEWEISDEARPLYLLLSGPNESEGHFYKEIGPGEKFETVTAAVAFGKDLDGALGELTRYRRRIVDRPVCDRSQPVIFNDYMNCLCAEPTEEKELPLIDRVAELGAEYFCMDAGWYADGAWWDSVGEWQPSAKRFPGGIKKVFDRVREKGMIPGIWLEIEVMGVNCPILDRFGDDCFFSRHGKRVIDRGRYQFDFRSPKVRAFTASVIDRLVKEYGIGYIKIDYNVDMGIGTDRDADSAGDGLLACNRAYLSWVEEIRQKYPELVLENCSSGGMRMDYAMLARHALQSVTDQENCLLMAPIAAAAASAVLPEQAAIWAYPKSADSDALTTLNMVNALPLRMHLSGEVMGWSEGQIARVKEGISVYKKIREKIPFSLPFYPLGLPRAENDFLASGYMCGGNAVLAVWRMGEKETVTLPLPREVKEVSVLYPTGSGAGLEAEGKALTVTLPESPSACLLSVIFEN